MEKFKFDVVSQTLTVTANFAEKMNDPESGEYKLVVQFQSDFPNLKIAKRTHKSPRKCTSKSTGEEFRCNQFKNLTCDRMEKFIDALPNNEGYVTEDRKGNGLILGSPIRVNTTLANLDALISRGALDHDKEYAVAEEYRKKLRTKCYGIEQKVGNLSGGNQQKVLLAKWMFTDPDILILDEPTRGIDVGAKYEIYCIINDLVAQGKSVVMISSELPEVLGMSDRIYVMNEGKIVGEFMQKDASQESIMACILKSTNN